MLNHASVSAYSAKADGGWNTAALTDRMRQQTLGEVNRSGTACPTCSETFDTEVAVKTHHQHHSKSYWDAKIELEHGVPVRDFLVEYYIEGEKSTVELGDIIGCSQTSACRLLKRHGIDRRDSNRDLLPWFGTNDNGYEYIAHNSKDGQHNVYIHRLMAVSKFGFEAVVENDVHHKSEVEWDNRMENIELMSHSKHRRYHAERQNSGLTHGPED